MNTTPIPSYTTPGSSLWLKLAWAFTASATLAASALAFEVINEDFSKPWSGTSGLSADGWTKMAYNTSGAPSQIKLDGSETFNAAKFNNVGITKNFSSVTTITQDFELTARITANNYQRSVYVLLTSAPDEDGKVSGYGLVLNTATAVLYNGLGAVSIQKIDAVNTASFVANNPQGSNITSPVEAGVSFLKTANGTDPASVSDFGTFRLTWNASTGLLSLFIGNSITAAATVTDTSFTSFTNIFVSGNGAGYFDQLTLTTTAIPEPGTYALIAGAGILLVVAYRRLH